MNQHMAAYDLFERQRQAAEFQMNQAAADALAYQNNTAVSPAQRAEMQMKAQQARDAYHQTLAGNQAQHERGLQRSAMDHKFGDQQLQRDLADKANDREEMKWKSLGGMFGSMGNLGGFGGGMGTPGISLHDNSGTRIGGTGLGASPLSGLTRK
jgi:hypothetical protein